LSQLLDRARVARAAPLAHDTLAAELAGVLENDRAGVIADAVEDERERLATGQEPANRLNSPASDEPPAADLRRRC
jgi:hypothetical protein